MLTKKGRKIMLTKSKIAVIVAVSGMVSASPAFAQSFNSPEGSGNSLPMHYDSRGGKHCDLCVGAVVVTLPPVSVATS